MGPHCLSQRLLKHFSRREKQMTCCDWRIKGNIKRTQKLQLQIQKDMLHVVAVVHNIVQALPDIMFMTYLTCN